MDSSTTSNYISTLGNEASVEREYERDFSPVSALNIGSPIEFLVPGTSLFYVSLTDSYFDIQVKITNLDGSNLANDAPVGPANLMAHTMFSNIELYLNGKQITEPTNHYHYRAYMDTLLNTSLNSLTKRKIMEGWLIDTSGHVNEPNAHDGDNAGLVARAAWFANSRSHRLILRPRLDLFNQEADIPPNTDIRIRLIPNSDAVVLMNSGNGVYRFQIQSIRFWAHTREMASNLLVSQQQLVHSGISYQIVFPTIRTKTLHVPIGTLRQEFDNLYLGQLPHRVIMVMLSGANVTGTFGSNPFNFQNFDLNYLALRVNGELVPRYGFTPNFGVAQDYIRDYLQVVGAIDLAPLNPDGVCLSPVEWANGFTFFAFKLFPNQGSLRANGSVRMDIRFGTQTTGQITILLISESMGCVEIDKYKNVILNTN